MDRAYESGAISTPPPPPSPPLTGYPTEGATPTVPGAWWFYSVTEELRGLEVAAGLTPSGTSINQVALAVQSLSSNASNLTSGTLNASRLPGTISSNTTGNAATSSITSAIFMSPESGTNNIAVASSTSTVAYNTNTALTAAGALTVLSVNVASDARLKHDIQPIKDADRILAGLHGSTWKWNADGTAGGGVIYQDLVAVAPECTKLRADGKGTVDYDCLIGVLVENANHQRQVAHTAEAISAGLGLWCTMLTAAIVVLWRKVKR